MSKIQAKIVGIERIYSLVDELKEVDKNKAIRSGLSRGAAVFVRVGRSELRRRNNEHTGSLMRSFTTRLAKKKLSAYSGFNRSVKLGDDKGLGNHAHLVDRGTTDRYTKKGAYRGKMPASYFWTETKRSGESEAMKKVESGVIQMVEKLKQRYYI